MTDSFSEGSIYIGRAAMLVGLFVLASIIIDLI